MADTKAARPADGLAGAAGPRGADPAGPLVRRVETLRCVSLRHLPGAEQVVASALVEAGLPGLPLPGRITGKDPWLTWRSPTDGLLVATCGIEADDLLTCLRPGMHPLACAVDRSDACIALEIEGTSERLEALLSRLIDAGAVPRGPLHGHGARLGDMPVVVLRLSAERAWLIADRRHEPCLLQCMTVALDAVGRDIAPSPGEGR